MPNPVAKYFGYPIPKEDEFGEFVDRLEDSPLPGSKLTLGSDATTCEISLRGFAGTITINRTSVVVRGRTSQAAGLFDLLLEFLTRFGPLGEPLALPPKRTV